jgi:formate-dependent nitrite reductase cytochrome c552 subunit
MGHKCRECDHQIDEPYRKLCWACYECHRRHGVSKEEWVKKKIRDGRICTVCKHFTSGTLRFHGRAVCGKCMITLETLMDPECRRRIVEEFD